MALTLAACAEPMTPTAPTGPNDPPVGLVDLPPPRRFITVCKSGPEGSFATFTITATGGTLLFGSPVTLTGVHPFGVQPQVCRTFWGSNGPTLETVVITETDQTPGTAVQEIVVFATTPYVTDIPNGSISIQVSGDAGATIFFKNGIVEEPPPPPGIEGCTPGFWKQSQHFQFWTGYTQGQTWGSVFADPGSTSSNKGQTFTANTSLLGAMSLGGGGILALARHAVAALLNSTSATVDYPLTTAQVVAAVNGALASGNYDAAKSLLAGYNEMGCGPRD